MPPACREPAWSLRSSSSSIAPSVAVGCFIASAFWPKPATALSGRIDTIAEWVGSAPELATWNDHTIPETRCVCAALACPVVATTRIRAVRAWSRTERRHLVDQISLHPRTAAGAGRWSERRPNMGEVDLVLALAMTAWVIAPGKEPALADTQDFAQAADREARRLRFQTVPTDLQALTWYNVCMSFENLPRLPFHSSSEQEGDQDGPSAPRDFSALDRRSVSAESHEPGSSFCIPDLSKYDLTLGEALEAFRVENRKTPSTRTLQRHCQEGRIDCFKLKTTRNGIPVFDWIIDSTSLWEFIQSFAKDDTHSAVATPEPSGVAKINVETRSGGELSNGIQN